MAGDYIKVDTSRPEVAPQAALLKGYVVQLRNAYNSGKHILGLMGHLHDSADFTNVELIFGLPPGKGQEVFDLVNGSIGSMEGLFQVDDARTITEQVG